MRRHPVRLDRPEYAVQYGRADIPAAAVISNQTEAFKVSFGPAGLVLDHAPEGLHFESLAGAVKRYGYPAAICRMPVVLVGTRLAIKNEPLSDKG